MQPTVNVPYTAAERGRISHRTSSLFRRFGSPVQPLKPAILICLLVLISHGTSAAQTAISKPTNSAGQTDAKKAFEKMKTLAGSWQGTIMGISINVTIRAASSGTAILHEAHTGGGRPPAHEITMFYLDGDRLLATHYCDAGNQARFEGKVSPDGKTIEFSFLDVAGGTRGGLLKRIVFTTIDADHHTIEADFMMPNGKPVPLRGEFQRTQ